MQSKGHGRWLWWPSWATALALVCLVGAPELRAQHRMNDANEIDVPWVEAKALRGMRTLVRAAILGWLSDGPERGHGEGMWDLALTLRAARSTFVVIRSRGLVPLDLGSPSGQHEVSGGLGLLLSEDGLWGLDLSLGARVEHEGERPLAMRSARMLRRPFRDYGLSLALRPKSIQDHLSLSLPVEYRFGRTHYAHGAEAASGLQERHAFSTGLSLGARDAHFIEGEVRFFATTYAWERSHLRAPSPPDGLPAADALRSRVDQLLFHLVQIDPWVLRVEDGAFWVVRLQAGVGAMWSEEQEMLAFSGKFHIGGGDADGQAGLGLGYGPQHLANGRLVSAFDADGQLDLGLGWLNSLLEARALVRGLSEWSGLERQWWSFTGQVGLVVPIFEPWGLEAGSYYRLDYDRAAVPWRLESMDGPYVAVHEGGIFVRTQQLHRLD